MKIKFCRNCKSGNLRKLFSLGRLKLIDILKILNNDLTKFFNI